jgi:hypothetical protein
LVPKIASRDRVRVGRDGTLRNLLAEPRLTGAIARDELRLAPLRHATLLLGEITGVGRLGMGG